MRMPTLKRPISGMAAAIFWSLQRFLIQNDQASYERVLAEFKELEKSQSELEKSLENPHRRELAWSARRNYDAYLSAFEEVYEVINERNQIIQGSLDRIGPQVAELVENLKLEIKAEQDSLGPKAEAAMERASSFATGGSPPFYRTGNPGGCPDRSGDCTASAIHDCRNARARRRERKRGCLRER